MSSTAASPPATAGPASDRFRSPLVPALGWFLAILLFGIFAWGLYQRDRVAASDEGDVIRMLFVPSVEQGTLVRRGDELARFIREDSGLILRSEVPTSYAAVIQALGSNQADVAWMPAFSYAVASARYDARARLQVVRTVDRFAIVVVREGEGQPDSLTALARRRVAVPGTLPPALRQRILTEIERSAQGIIEVPVASDKEAIRLLLEKPLEFDAAISSYVFSGPHDLIGDGRKELEYERPGALRETRILYTTDAPVAEEAAVYYGCFFTRTDSGAHRLEDFTGRSFAFSDETSTSGHIFPNMLLRKKGISLGRIYFAGGHPNVVQAVWDGKAVGGAAFYSPPGAQQARDGTLVGDARMLLMKRLPDVEARRKFLDEVRVVALSDPIPNDVCVTRAGFSERLWERFEASLQRFLKTPVGREAYFDLVAGVAAIPTNDAAFDEFRGALQGAGMSADSLLAAEEEKLRKKREKEKK